VTVAPTGKDANLVGDSSEAEFYQVVHHTAGLLWALGAIEDTLAALYDVWEAAPPREPSTVDG
jgi:hypothetical protein